MDMGMPGQEAFTNSAEQAVEEKLLLREDW
jgi:hypothetical protein